MNHRLLAGIAITASLILLVACAAGTNRPAGQTSTPPAAGPAVSLVRTGGLAGVHDQVVVAADGTWSATDRAGARRTGHLSGQQHATLTRLAGDPGIAAESARTQAPTRCADAYTYDLTVRASRVVFVDCPTDAGRPPVATQVIQLISQAVWG